MQIREATIEDFGELKSFYCRMNEVINRRTSDYNPDNAVFPSDNMIKDAIDQGGQFIGVEDGIIVIACIVKDCDDEAYSKVAWKVDANAEEVWILHALRVAPEYEGRGFAKQMLTYIIDLAPERGRKAIRLDVLEGYPVEGLYLRFGFQHIDTVEILYEDIGSPKRFRMFEKEISPVYENRK